MTIHIEGTGGLAIPRPCFLTHTHTDTPTIVTHFRVLGLDCGFSISTSFFDL